ncbi:DUF2284 domain-containing protein [Methanonatronarchaeum sp. AMET-Sl]|uniref:DUF2284 domain-containing protein n=1 Tax=Methanonatronarchaeum sp. AMET-Sl TaxID=3037654 RepID=UPI00244DD4B1|nr:DUF2284 domain-containing protein [Methanonatronarchaeum sp. AMET-Sl]WGI18117.1 DUF2284 domain-containing protein [Methanonatronarchaeum sp. AMET-Sl]
MNKKEIEEIFHQKGFKEYKWINPKDIEIREWVRIKCQNCPNYGTAAHCPPHTPTVQRSKRFFKEYKTAVIFHITKTLKDPNQHPEWTDKINQQLIEIENELFLNGYHKTYTLFIGPCKLCQECTGTPKTCRHPKKARPSAEAMAIDVYNTAKKHNYPINTLTDYNQKMNRYPFLLIE